MKVIPNLFACEISKQMTENIPSAYEGFEANLQGIIKVFIKKKCRRNFQRNPCLLKQYKNFLKDSEKVTEGKRMAKQFSEE